MTPLHYAVVNDFGLYANRTAACGNNFRRAKHLTDDWREVSCRHCIELCGFEAAADEQFVEVEHLGPGRIAA